MQEQFSRTALLLGDDGVQRLTKARVAVFGIGGVGGYAVEALARSGIGALDLVDHDTVSLSNINRQIIATHDTLGKLKVEVAKERIHAINPDCHVRTFPVFFLPDTVDTFDFSQYDYVVDAIDTVTAKLLLAEKTYAAGIPLISAMGTGNKLDPTAFEVTDINKTTFCPLARIMRKELKKRGIPHLKVVYSQEPAMTPGANSDEPVELAGRKPVPGSTAFVPAVAGLILAGEVIKDLAGVSSTK